MFRYGARFCVFRIYTNKSAVKLEILICTLHVYLLPPKPDLKVNLGFMG